MMVGSSSLSPRLLLLLLLILLSALPSLSPVAVVDASGVLLPREIAPCPASFPREMCLGGARQYGVVAARKASNGKNKKPPLAPPNVTLPYIRQLLQQAVKVEHSTIPLYLTALYSIVDEASFAAKAVRSVVVEEMLHMTAAANVLNAIGGSPSIDSPDFVPSFPLRLTWINVSADIRNFDRRTVSNFIHIESPPGSWPHLTNVTKSISEVYLYVADLLQALCMQFGEEMVIIGDPARQVLATTAEGEAVPKVTNLTGAMKALIGVADQGSGCPVPGKSEGWPMVTSIFAGPMGGGLAHFARFNEIQYERMYGANDTWATGPRGANITPPIQWADVFRFQPNPKISNFPVGTPAHTASVYFARNYTNLLHKLHDVFNGQPDTLMSTMGAMYKLRTLAVGLMKTRDPRMPPTNPPMGIGPPWEYVPLSS